MSDAAMRAAIVVGAGLAACLGTRALIPLLIRAAMLDRPNERSSHYAPTPRGGGIAVVAAVVLAWLALAAQGLTTALPWPVLAGGVLLALVSWIDDRRGLAPLPRLVAQFAAIGAGMAALHPAGAVFQGWLPPAADAAATALLWVWFVNLFNFMDGIDGLAGSEAAAIGTGLAMFAALGIGRDPTLATPAAAAAAAALGFLVWNWAPARIFLGDVGSVPLGYLLGFLLLSAASGGHWRLALILPLYFLADATITLARRLLRGERVWQPHREHFYQRAVRRGLGHAAVVRRVLAADLALIALGWAAENGWGVAAPIVAVILVLALLASLAGLRQRGAPPIPAASPRAEEKPP
ncbi:MAG TPA: glycosyltransferase family 4 protein [Stellaceae bacterium]|nr:glycosyltransferase family 4 protein [Stellaceae bacterium]